MSRLRTGGMGITNHLQKSDFHEKHSVPALFRKIWASAKEEQARQTMDIRLSVRRMLHRDYRGLVLSTTHAMRERGNAGGLLS